MSQIVCDRGALYLNLQSTKHELSFVDALYEAIDNRHHSESIKVFIDLNCHVNQISIGYENLATLLQVKNMVQYYQVSDVHESVKNISCRGVGLSVLEFFLPGKWIHIANNSNEEMEYFYSKRDTKVISEALFDTNKFTNDQFSLKLQEATKNDIHTFPPNAVAVNVFKENNDYPFQAKTLIIGNIDKDINLLNKIGCIESLIKRLKIKYAYEIKIGNINLYIKIPNNQKFQNVKDISNGIYDVIGYTKPDKKLSIQIDLSNNTQIIFRIENNYYGLTKDINARKAIEIDVKSIEFKTDIQFTLWTTEINNQVKDAYCNDALKHYKGIYIMCNGTFTSDKPILLANNSSVKNDLRGVIEPKTSLGKSNINFKSTKSDSCIANKSDEDKKIKLEDIIIFLRDKYPDYLTEYLKNKNNINHNEYILKNKTMKENTNPEMKYFYLMNIGEKFYKLGISSELKKIKSYGEHKKIENTKSKFVKFVNDIYDYPVNLFGNLPKIRNADTFESKLKKYIGENTDKYTSYAKILVQGEYFSLIKEENLVDLLKWINNNIKEHLPKKRDINNNENKDTVSGEQNIINENNINNDDKMIIKSKKSNNIINNEKN